MFPRLFKPVVSNKLQDRHVTGGHKIVIFLNFVILSGSDNAYRRPSGAVVCASQVVRSLAECCRLYLLVVDCECITHGWLNREDET